MENNRRRMGSLEESARLLHQEWFVHLRSPDTDHQHQRRRSGGLENPAPLKTSVLPPRNCPTRNIGTRHTLHRPGHMPRRSIALNARLGAEAVTSSKIAATRAAATSFSARFAPLFSQGLVLALTDGVASLPTRSCYARSAIFYSFAFLMVSSDWFVKLREQTTRGRFENAAAPTGI